MTQTIDQNQKKLDYGVVKSAGNAAYAFKTSEHTEVEVGDPSSEQFTPKLSLFKWNREVHLKLYPSQDLLRNAQTQQAEQDLQSQQSLSATKQSVALPTTSLDQNQIKHSAGTVDYRFYPLDPAEQMEDGGVEFEFTLNQKPDRNSFVFPIETRNLVFHYQPELTDDEKAQGFCRPDNVVGSYAVYHALRGNVHNGEAVAQKYKTGKAFHIYRPKVTDAQGNSVWAQLCIDADQGTLTITVPQDFLDSATYPVTVDPTFGYTSLGATSSGYGANMIMAGLFTTPVGAANSAWKISVGLWPAGGPLSHAKCGLYKDSDRSFLHGTTERTNITISGNIWYDFQISPSYTLPDTTAVDICVWSDTAYYCRIDSVAGQTNKVKSQAYGAWPDPLNPWTYTNSDIEMSIYCMYGQAALTVVAPAYGGSVSPAVGIHYYDPFTVVPVTATPDGTHVFNAWLLDGANVGSANPYNVTMDGDHAIQPSFVASTLGIALTDLDSLITWGTP